MKIKVEDELGNLSGITTSLLRTEYDGTDILIIGELKTHLVSITASNVHPVVETRFFNKNNHLLDYTYGTLDGSDLSSGHCLFRIEHRCSDVSHMTLKLSFRK